MQTSSDSEVVWHFQLQWILAWKLQCNDHKLDKTIYEHLEQKQEALESSSYRWWDVYTCTCWRMSASMSSPSPSLFGSFVRCFYFAMLFGSFIRCFHLAICASTPVILIFILILRVTSLDSRPKRQQSRPTSGSQGSKCEHTGGPKNFRGGPNTSVEVYII